VNVVAGLLYLALALAFQRYDLPWLFAALFVVTLLIFALAVLNIAAVYFLWNRYGLRCFYPVLLFAAVVTLCFYGQRYGTRFVLAGTPCRPDSFLVGRTRGDLEGAAKQALGHSLRSIWREQNGQMSADRGDDAPNGPHSPLPPQVTSIMSRYGFRAIRVDDAQSVVTFSYVHLRTWYSYTYTTDQRVPLGSRPPTISERDVDWCDLIRIVRDGAHVTNEEARRNYSNLDMAYAYLRRYLGQNEVNRLIRDADPQCVKGDDRQFVLAALNKQWSPAGSLVENVDFSFDRVARELHIGPTHMDESFWVVRLVSKLFSEGVVTYVYGTSHLKLKDNMSPSDSNRVAWLHFGLMEELYPNLLDKAEHLDDKELGGGWYFRVGY